MVSLVCFLLGFCLLNKSLEGSSKVALGAPEVHDHLSSLGNYVCSELLDSKLTGS